MGSEMCIRDSLGTTRSYSKLPLYIWKLNAFLERDWSRFDVVLATTHLPFAQIVTRLSRFDSEFLYVLHGMYGVKHTGIPGLMTRWLYNARKLISVSNEFLNDEMLGNYGVRSRQKKTIYNPLDTAAIDSQLLPFVGDANLKQIVNVGRYSPEKNQKDAIAVFDASGLAKEGYRLAFLGEGPDRAKLKEEIVRRGLTGSVELTGFVENPFREIRRSAAVLHTAEYESFGMVVVETHYCGTPIVVYDVPFGARETMPGALSEFLAPYGAVSYTHLTLPTNREV